jgi:uncharacterized protein (TIGR03435 family)
MRKQERVGAPFLPNQRRPAATILLPLVALLLNAAPEAQPVSFEAASVKPAAPGITGYEGTSRSKVEYTSNRLTMSNVDLNDCVQWAYGIREDQISGGNDLGGERYEVLAKSAVPVPVSQLRIMLQNLLAKRFMLTVRRQRKLVPVYELTVSKRGAKLPAAKADDGASSSHAAESLPRVLDGSFVFSETSMAEFAQKLSMLQGVERPVLDRTGIEGFYDFTLKGAAAAVRENDGSLFGLVEDQLGLRLVSAKDALEIFTIEHVEKPTPD